VIGNRTRLELYANVRPVKLLPGVQHKIHGVHKQVWEAGKVDMVIVRENTEDLYCGMGGILRAGGTATAATDVRLITRAGCERIIRYAFKVCAERDGAPADGVKRLTAIVKNNVLEGCRMFVEIFDAIGEAEFPEIERDIAIVDAFTQWLVLKPERYDVCVTTNMFGDIVTDLASVLQGGMGMAVGCNLGDRHAMFEPIHGSAPPLAGRDRANPLATLLAAGEMLRWLGRQHDDAALIRGGDGVEAAVSEVVAAGEPLTADLVGADRGAPLSAVAAAVQANAIARLS
jgi:3-isopropylmalate dehydrogenase